MSNKSVRIRTIPGGSDKFITIKLEEQFDFLEVLSLKISQEDLYRNFCADYGVVVGRVIANRGFGVPNAKVSIFIPITNEDSKNDLIRTLYPFKTPTDKDSNFIRYNLLLSESTCNLNTPVGTFPSKEKVLNNEIILEIYDKYYKYTTKTNESGDYMLFGVPTGEQIIHMDVDFSDISLVSVRPYDLIDAGASEKLFESPVEFKTSTDIDSLPQIKSINKTVTVVPFWGDVTSCEIGINRIDFDTNYEIKPNALFMGSVFTDVGKQSLNKSCNPRNDMGDHENLRTGSGRIEMIRAKTINPNDWVNNGEITPTELEEFLIEGGDLIDEDGTFSTTLPMNVGHVITNEFGNIVPSPDPSIGIPTKGLYRFKINLDEAPTGRLRRTAQMLFPSLSKAHGGTEGYTSTGNVNNIGGTEDQRFTTNIEAYKDIKKDFHTMDWKQVYTISQYIKKYKKGGNRFSFIGLKNTDKSTSFNPLPFNNAVYKTDIIFSLISFFIRFIASIYRTLIRISGISINFGFALRFSVLGAEILNRCGITSFTPFSFLSALLPKELDCGDKTFDINTSCTTSGKCDFECENKQTVLGVYTESGKLTKPSSGNYFNICFNVKVPGDSDCPGITQITQWECCSVYELAVSRNVIRYSFIDSWLTGSAYLFQFKYKSKLKTKKDKKTKAKYEYTKEKFCGPGSDNPGGDNYKTNSCCPHNKITPCNKCLLRGPNDTHVGDTYHRLWHNATVNNDCSGLNCGNGASDVGDIIYCNTWNSTKIINLGSIEMCEDLLNEFNKQLNINTNIGLTKYKQNPNYYIGSGYEEGFDPNVWSENLDSTTYNDPSEVVQYLMLVNDSCRLLKLFDGLGGCHERTLTDNNYMVVKEVSKIQTDIILTDLDDQPESFDPTKTDSEGNVSGISYSVRLGQRFHPCVGDGICLPPPSTWTFNNTQNSVLISDNQGKTVGPGSNHNNSKNTPYFYFGLIPGKTAIDKLRKKFFFNKDLERVRKNPFI
jgi:hypothetical protein